MDAGEALLIAYPGYEYIKAAVNCGEDLWERANLKGARDTMLWKTAKLDAHDTATVTLNERGKYRNVQEARDIHCSDDRKKFDSDEIFANFRSMSDGRLKKNAVYRAASPCDSQYNRAPYTDALMKEAGVKCILNLSDNEEKIGRYISVPASVHRISFPCMRQET